MPPPAAHSPVLSLVVPTYNESENLAPLLTRLAAVLKGIPHEILIVDDDSPDRTGERAESLRTSFPALRVIRRRGARGLGFAVLEGFAAARGAYLGVIDADLSHDEKILPKLLRHVQDGAELAVGSRRIRGGGADHWPWYRRSMSSVATGLSKLLLRLQLSDPMSGYFVVSRSFLEKMKGRPSPRGYKILLEIYCKGRPSRVAEEPFIFKDRKQGVSKLSTRVVVQYFQMLAMLFFDESAQRVRRRYHTGRYRKVAAWLKPGELLDLGCGRPCETMPDGAFLRFMGRGTGVDVKACDLPFPFVQTDVASLPFADGAFDSVTAMEILEHVSDPRRVLAQIVRVVKDDGVVVVSFPRETKVWEMIWHVWEKTYGFVWDHTHTGARSFEEWKPLIAEFFSIEAVRMHWRFDLLLRLRKKKLSV